MDRGRRSHPPAPSLWLPFTSLCDSARLQLDGNCFGGTLPAEWAHSKVARVMRRQMCPAWLRMGQALHTKRSISQIMDGFIPFTPPVALTILPNTLRFMQATLLSLAGNALTGPAFPPAWLERGSLRSLEHFLVGGTALTGTLPPGLAWPKLQQL